MKSATEPDCQVCNIEQPVKRASDTVPGRLGYSAVVGLQMEIPVQKPLADVADHREGRAPTHASTVTDTDVLFRSDGQVDWQAERRDGRDIDA